MSFFDAAERGALTLTLSRNDPFDAEYLTSDGTPFYRVYTRKLSTGMGRPDAEITCIQRVRLGHPAAAAADAALASGSSSHSHSNSGSSAHNINGSHYRLRRCVSRRRRTSSSMSTPLDTIDEVAVADADADVLGSGSDSDLHADTISVATIERRPFSLTPVRLKFNGREDSANKFLRRERPFSSTRCFVSITGDLLRWQLSTPTPKLYDSNKVRIAKYCAPFIPSKGMLSSKTAVIEITEGVESDRALDEIIVTFLLTFLL